MCGTRRSGVEKLKYIHRNPVKRGLVAKPEQWAWSSFRAYAYREKGPARVNFQEWELKIKARKRESFGSGRQRLDPTQIATCAIEWGTLLCI